VLRLPNDRILLREHFPLLFTVGNKLHIFIVVVVLVVVVAAAAADTG
jgi:hypothetical protein